MMHFWLTAKDVSKSGLLATHLLNKMSESTCL
jgi:hypothetical protein